MDGHSGCPWVLVSTVRGWMSGVTGWTLHMGASALDIPLVRTACHTWDTHVSLCVRGCGYGESVGVDMGVRVSVGVYMGLGVGVLHVPSV